MADPELSRVELHQLALQEGIRSLEDQRVEVSRIRDRVVNLVALTATSTAFLVGAALNSTSRNTRFYAPLAVGTGLFVALLILGWMILRPLKQWNAKISPTVMVEDFADGLEGYRALVSFYDRAQAENEAKLDRLRTYMQWALLTSGAVTISWIALVWLVAS